MSSPAPDTQADGRSDDGSLRILEVGDLQILGLLPRSSNYTFLVRVDTPSGDRALAVYKPQAGESPLWDFPGGTLGRREVAAYVVSRALGWPFVPATLFRDGPEGPGSVQLFVEFDPSEHSFTLLPRHRPAFRRIALFDAVVNNADRKGGHCLLVPDGRIAAIDHGVCFHAQPKLRTVIWDFAGDRIPDEEASDMRRLAASLRDGPERRTMAPLLSAQEIDATIGRVETLLCSGRFPAPGGEHPYPWPAI